MATDLPQVRAETLVVESYGEPVRYSVDFGEQRLRISPTRELREKGGRLYVDFANVFGQHVLHPWVELVPRRGG